MMVMISLGSVQKLTKASILSNAISRKKKTNFLVFRIKSFVVVKLQKFNSNVISYSVHGNEASKINCISRKDKDKNIFLEKTDRKGRWNLYSQIAIENDKLICAKNEYNLTDICNTYAGYIEQQPCTLLDTSEVVDINVSPDLSS